MKKDGNFAVPESVLKVAKEAQESYKRLVKNLSDIVPKIPRYDLPTIPEIPDFLNERESVTFSSPEITREKNAWERHKEIIDIQNALLGIQSKLLDEQKSNTKLTKIVIGLSILTIVISVISTLF